ncbi:aminopeptidase [Variovorax ginsengisoli]|uniref:Aminopeptidase n=1 Tax=Variovorax ginsengisoli TaxID=363844 RepID=A0ABT9SCJ1_9BURK|nr:aminopeptidase [Variovorax ginsengisoli]MDP9902061.1 putative aminopeptidase [Variovorax ginsengisoli]
MRPWRSALRTMLALGLALVLAGCADLGYYWQSASGHLGVMRAARPVDDWLADPTTSAALKAKLELTQRIRRFAVTDVGLPDNRSYTGYADLHRRAAVWNVVAAPRYALTLETWCFPVAGCVGYRGYYDEALANREAEVQRAKGLEVSVYPVPAYSTLGWLNWAGGDPLLSTFIGYPEGELARLIFHELAHQMLYVPDDTRFNESFATAVERIGGARWLASRAGDAARAEYAQFDLQRQQFRALALSTRQQLEGIYGSNEARAGDWPAVEAMKQAAMRDFHARYAQLKAGWSGPRQNAYDAWVARANNAMFGAQAAYDDLVPAFEALHAREGGDWPRFYAEVRRIAALPKAERLRALQALQPATAAAYTREVALRGTLAISISPSKNGHNGG